MIKLNKILLLIIIFFLCNKTFAADLKTEFNNRILSKINQFSDNLVDGIADGLRENEKVKHFDISLDLQDKLKPSIEIQSVNKIREDNNGAIFNQTNFVFHDSDATLNFGIGKRNLFNDDKLMIGSNLFVDFHIDESHLRTGAGIEVISSVFDLTGNYYNAISGFKVTREGREKALDGYDLQIDYHIGKSTDIFMYSYEWENPNSDFEDKGNKFGLNSQIGNLNVQVGYLNDNQNTDGIFGSLKLVVPLGGENSKNVNVKNESSKFASVRHKLYMPVKRENKIKVVKISGVSISGF
tara:strand:+ start:37 stop:924 length:888 start_codon:yes stop_codon:yes gene_type:complete